MIKNVGTQDRILRFALAAVAVVAAFLVGPTSVWGIILFVVAVVLVGTGLVGFCPIWRLLGVNTHRSKTDAMR